MKANAKNIIPVLLGADLNAYSVALAFRESYGVTSHVFARYKCGAVENSKFIVTHIHAGIDDAGIAVPALLKFAAENNGAELFLIPCADWYVEMLQHARGQLQGIYNVYIPDFSVWRRVSDKDSFYSLLKKEKIPFPEYVAFKGIDELTEENLLKISYPAVVKPSDSTEYWRYSFPDMKKVYFVNSRYECVEIIKKIFASGYKKSIIVQRRIGDKDGNRVLTTVSDSNGKVVRAVLADVILEERGKTSYGNHAAVITRPLDTLSFQIIDMLNKLRYSGIANIDIMRSGRDCYVLELNPRQGRSCDYLRAAGVNIATLIMRSIFGEAITPDFSFKRIYWHHPPHKAIVKYAHREMASEAERLRQEGKEYTPYSNGYEGLTRNIYALIHGMRINRNLKKTSEKKD